MSCVYTAVLTKLPSTSSNYAIHVIDYLLPVMGGFVSTAVYTQHMSASPLAYFRQCQET